MRTSLRGVVSSVCPAHAVERPASRGGTTINQQQDRRANKSIPASPPLATIPTPPTALEQPKDPDQQARAQEGHHERPDDADVCRDELTKQPASQESTQNADDDIHQNPEPSPTHHPTRQRARDRADKNPANPVHRR